jgi:FdhD protein
VKKAARVKVVRFEDGRSRPAFDSVAGEEPLEILVAFPGQPPQPLSVTMRTQGNDYELSAGFLFTEGLVRERRQVKRIAYCGRKHQYNRVQVHVTDDLGEEAFGRKFYVTSSCGICGTASLELVEKAVSILPEPVPELSLAWLQELPAQLAQTQVLFEQTGGLHACALFRRHGDLLLAREDVGRHNALDKLVGRLFLDQQLPARDTVLLLSGRASFELIQKAVMAGIPAVAALGAPSSLAIELAQRFGLVLVGFLKAGRCNVYAGTDRIAR